MTKRFLDGSTRDICGEGILTAEDGDAGRGKVGDVGSSARGCLVMLYGSRRGVLSRSSYTRKGGRCRGEQI